MKCPICGCEMQDGGLIVNGIGVLWFPKEQFETSSIKNLSFYVGGKNIYSRSNILLGQTKIPNAFFCGSCKKIVGIFDTTNNE